MGEVTRREVLRGAAVLGAAAMVPLAGDKKTPGRRHRSLPAAGAAAGAYIDAGQYPGNLTHAQAVAAWEANTGRKLAAQRHYLGPGGSTPTSVPVNVVADITAGRTTIMSVKPYFYGAPPPLGGGTSQAALDSAMKTFMAECNSAGLVNAIIPVWHEPYYGGINGTAGRAGAADFIAMFRHYSPIIRSYGYPVAFVTSAGSVLANGENAYYPGDAYVDVCATDYYYPQYGRGNLLGTGAATDAALPADLGGKPFGVFEFNNSTDPVLGCTQAQAGAYWQYLRDYFSGRLSSGKPCAPLCVFNSDSGSANPRDSAIVAADGMIDPYGGGTATEYRNALFGSLSAALGTAVT